MIDRAIQEDSEPLAASDRARPAKADTHPSSCRMLVKVVPGCRASAIVGLLGNRIKIKVSAPPEDGKANEAVCALVAGRLGLSSRAVRVVVGPTNPEKTLRIIGISAAEVRLALGVVG